jgi:hypothetical protein
MDVATVPAVPDPSDTMKAPYLSRRLAKEKTTCPGCHKTMQVGTLAWSHRCRVVKSVPEHVVQERLDQMLQNAHKSFQQRQTRNAELDCPMEAASQEDAAIVNGHNDAQEEQSQGSQCCQRSFF